MMILFYRKLAQLRCEITQALVKDEPTKATLVSELSSIQEENKAEEDDEDDEQNAKCLYCKGALQTEDVINENLVSNLIENIKLDANLNEDKSIIVANSVIKTLSENVPFWNSDCKKILGN